MEYVEKPEGATPDKIQFLEESIEASLPDDFRDLLLESDGPILYFGYKELQFFSTTEIQGHDIFRLKEYMPGCIPICLDGSGNLCVGRIEDQNITGYYVVSIADLNWEEAGFISESFQEFLRDKKPPEKRLFA